MTELLTKRDAEDTYDIWYLSVKIYCCLRAKTSPAASEQHYLGILYLHL